MKGGREGKGLGGGGGGGGGGAPPSADLLVCFPSKARLTLMPKPICSPVRPNSEPNKRHLHLRKINTTRGRAAGGGPPSPLLWAKGNRMSAASDIAEPTSPKVTCAGQIKVRPRSSSGSGSASRRNWQSVMEEIERLHNSRSSHKRNKSKHWGWGEALGFKKDVINFLTCLGNIRFDFRCFGSFPDPGITSDEEDEQEDEDEEEETTAGETETETEVDDQRNTVFSKWFMVLQENRDMNSTDNKHEKHTPEAEVQVEVPPPNALLLMRCRSAPAAKRSNWLQVQDREHQPEKEDETMSKQQVDEDEDEHEVADKERERAEEKNNVQQPAAALQDIKPKKKRRESLAIVMKYDPDFYNVDLSSHVSQETWLVGDFQDTFSRSRSWKR